MPGREMLEGVHPGLDISHRHRAQRFADEREKIGGGGIGALGVRDAAMEPQVQQIGGFATAGRGVVSATDYCGVITSKLSGGSSCAPIAWSLDPTSAIASAEKRACSSLSQVLTAIVCPLARSPPVK